MVDKIKNRIKTLGIKKNHLAKIANMHPSALSHVLNGSRSLTLEQESKIKNYLGI